MRNGNRLVKWASVAVLIAMLIVTGLAIRELPGIKLQNSVHTWLSPDSPEARVLEWCREHFPEKDQVLVSWNGSSLDDPRVNRFAEALAGKTDSGGTRIGGLSCVDEVITPQQLVERITQQGVDEAEAIDRLRGTLIGVVDSDHDFTKSSSGVSPVAILATLSESGSADPRASLQAIRDKAEACGISPGDLHLGGDIVTSSALDAEVVKASWNWIDPLQRPPVFLLSGLFGALLAVRVLRSVRLGIMVLVCAYITALVGTALVPFFGRTMNMVLIVMPTLLIVLALSAAIHLANYWKHAAASRMDHPIRQAIRMGWLPCLLAAVTTGIGLMSLSISSLEPIRDFGIFASVGTLVSLVVVLIGLPSMLVVRPVESPAKSEVNHPHWHWLGQFLSRHSGKVASISLLLFITASCGLYWFRTEVKVARYFPEGSQLAADYSFLEQKLGGVAPVEIVVAFNEEYSETLGFLDRMELIRSVEKRLREHPEISGALSLADFQPVTAPLAEDAGFLTRTRYTVRARTVESRVKQNEAAEASAFLVAGSAAGFGDWAPGTPLDEVWRIRAQAYVTSDVDYGELTADLNEIVATLLKDNPGVEHKVTGTVPVFFRAQQALLQSLIRSFCLAFAVIALAMIVLLRSFRAGVLSMLPNLMPIGMVFGAMSWCGQILDIGTMLTASVALGISVDGMLHLLTWFRKAIAEGQSRHDAVTFALQHCGPAMAQTSAVIGLSLLVLYPAELLLISRFGWVMATLIGSALVAEVIFLPVLLIGPLGRMIQQTVAAAQLRERRPRDLDDWNAAVYQMRNAKPVWGTPEEVRGMIRHAESVEEFSGKSQAIAAPFAPPPSETQDSAKAA
ncbi:MAG: MMPL family transporter [Rhodopirellula sp.]|nr:MMPL family transporter [Rhodopirellula sp.]